MAEAVVLEERLRPSQRFYCHVCNQEFSNISTDFTCPVCSSGFIEELPEHNPLAQRPDSSDNADADIEMDATSDSSSISDLLNSGFRDTLPGSEPAGNDASASTTGRHPSRRRAVRLNIRNPDYWRSGQQLAQPAGGGSSNGASSGGTSDAATTAAPGQNLSLGPTFYNTYDNFIRDFFISVTGGLGVPGTTTTGYGTGGRRMLGGPGGRHPQVTLEATMTPMFFIGNPGDYAWGHDGLDSVITLLWNQMETTGPPPMSAQKIEEIPKFEIKAEEIEKKLQCSVCLEDFQLSEQCRKLPCAHIFHETCIIPWLELHGTCPICRETFADQSANDEDEESEMETGNAVSTQNNYLPLTLRGFANESRRDGERTQSNENSIAPFTAPSSDVSVWDANAWINAQTGDSESSSNRNNRSSTTTGAEAAAATTPSSSQSQSTRSNTGAASTATAARVNGGGSAPNSSNSFNFPLDDVLD